MERGFGTGRGVDEAKAAYAAAQAGAPKGKVGKGGKGKMGVRDVKGTSRPTEQGEDWLGADVRGSSERMARKRDGKVRGREKARTRRREETREFMRGSESRD